MERVLMEWQHRYQAVAAYVDTLTRENARLAEQRIHLREGLELLVAEIERQQMPVNPVLLQTVKRALRS